jgi:hypothetical protein
MVLTVCLKTDKVFTLIFAVFLQAGGLHTLIFMMRSQLGSVAERTDITDRYLSVTVYEY